MAASARHAHGSLKSCESGQLTRAPGTAVTRLPRRRRGRSRDLLGRYRRTNEDPRAPVHGRELAAADPGRDLAEAMRQRREFRLAPGLEQGKCSQLRASVARQLVLERVDLALDLRDRPVEHLVLLPHRAVQLENAPCACSSAHLHEAINELLGVELGGVVDVDGLEDVAYLLRLQAAELLAEFHLLQPLPHLRVREGRHKLLLRDQAAVVAVGHSENAH
mmetsp:Transcript_114223/g.323492  ORF Transcript_114223/g.323492 Transcript_114223/m.323492 type:complete len:220 (+) Transcript_114223:108-767(+)